MPGAKVRFVIPVLAVVAALAMPSKGGVTYNIIPLSPYGDSIGGSAGTPIPLTSSSFVAATRGADNLNTTAYDRGTICRLSPTRVMLINGGASAAYGGADDGVYLVDDLGGANTVTNIPVGFLAKPDDVSISLWRRFGSRRVENILITDSPDSIRQRHVEYLVTNENYLSENAITLTAWLHRVDADLIATIKARGRVNEGPKDWYLIRLRPGQPKTSVVSAEHFRTNPKWGEFN